MGEGFECFCFDRVDKVSVCGIVLWHHNDEKIHDRYDISLGEYDTFPE